MGRNLDSEILKFVGDLPYWQRYLAASVVGLVDAERVEVIEEAYAYLLADHDLGERKDKLALAFPEPAPEGAAATAQGVRLVGVKDAKNVNAVRGGQTLPIAKTGVTAIGGLNGAGKSSLVRLFNSVFYSRGDDEILPNIFEPHDGEPASAVFIFEKPDGSQYELSYIADGNHEHPEFGQFASFDSKCINVHLNEENELHVAPRGFHFFRELAELTNAVLHRLSDAIEKISEENPFIDQIDGASQTRNLIAALGPSTSSEEVERHLTFGVFEEQRAAAIRKEVEELNVNAVETRRRDLAEVKRQLDDLKARIETDQKMLSEESIRAIESGLVQLGELKQAIQQTGAQRFKDSGVRGSGGDVWKLFVGTGKKLADIQHDHYPVTGDPCLFCSQKLSEEAAAQVRAYWEFLSSDTEAKLKTLEGVLRRKASDLSALRLAAPEETSVLARWFLVNAAEDFAQLKAHFEALASVRDALADALKSGGWKSVALDSTVSLDSLVARVEKELSEIDTKALLEKKAALESEVRDLAHREKLAAKKGDVLAWIARRKWAEAAQKVKRGISTKSITDNGKRLFDEHVTKKYKQVFHQECERLQARFRLELTHTGKGGKSHRKYQIEGYPPGKILSEGEQRAVSLADFITELKISGISSGWVFDDPVNSQDIERKDLIAKMLVEEARERQIIVFSHDVTFLYDLNGWHIETGVPIRFHWVERQGLDAGIIYPDLPPNFERAYIDPSRAEEKLAEAKNPSLNPMERENRLKEGFSCLRTSYETFVVQKMLANTVVRFDRRIGYESIESIYAPPAWTKRVARKLKKLSGYIEGHSHSDMGRKPLTVQMLEDEIAEFKQMKKDFGAEKAISQQEAAALALLAVNQAATSTAIQGE